MGGAKMIPIDQTIASGPDADCLRACVASVLNEPIDSIPNFREHANWFGELTKYLHKFNLVPIAGAPHLDGETIRIVVGPSEHGTRHAVIYSGGEMVHDPHPSRSGIDNPDMSIFFGVIDPSVMAACVMLLLGSSKGKPPNARTHF